MALLQIQQTYPKLRIMQIIGNAFTGHGNDDLYYKADEELAAALEAYARSHSQPAKNESRE